MITREEFVYAMRHCHGRNEDVDYEALWQEYQRQVVAQRGSK